MEAMGDVVVTIAQASVAGGKGGSSNLQRFKEHHPPAFIGGGGIRWWLNIGSDRLRRFWRLWKSPSLLHMDKTSDISA